MDSNLFPAPFRREHMSRSLQLLCHSLQRQMRENSLDVKGFVAARGNQ
jgi:hypothetical protein